MKKRMTKKKITIRPVGTVRDRSRITRKRLSALYKAGAVRRAKLDMKRLGFQTIEEYIRYYDKQRGY